MVKSSTFRTAHQPSIHRPSVACGCRDVLARIFLVYLFRAYCNSAPSDPQLEAATRGRFEHTAIERLCDETAVVSPLASRPKR